MRKVLALVLFVGLIPLAPAAFSGCSSADDGVLEYDSEVSEQKRTEYEQQMQDAMKNRPEQPGRP